MPLPSTWIEIELNPEELVLWMSPFTQSQLSDLRSAETEEDIQKVLTELYEEDPGLRDFISDVEECAKKFELNFGFLSDDIALLRGSSKSIRACHAYLETIARDC